MPESLDLPAVEPTSRDVVKAHMRIGDDVDDADVDAAVAAACAEVRGLPVAQRARGLTAWPSNVTLGATMLAAGMVPRRRKPSGGAVFPVDGTVDLLLERGAFARPSVG